MKKSNDEETHTETEEKKEAVEEQDENEQNGSPEHENTSPTKDVKMLEEVKVTKDATDKEDKAKVVQVVRKSTELAIVEDEEDSEIDLESENPFSPEYKPKPEELEESYEAPTQSTALQIDQSA